MNCINDVKKYLKALNYDYYKNQRCFDFDISLEDNRKISYEVCVEEWCCVFSGKPDIEINPERIDVVVEYLARINFYSTLTKGYLSDDKVIFKNHIQLEYELPENKVIEKCIMDIAEVISEYEKGIIKVSSGLLTPEKAFEEIFAGV